MDGLETAAPLRVLRLASVFEVERAHLGPRAARFDPVGGMQTHTAALTRALDGMGVRQKVVTSRLSGPRGERSSGAGTVIRRVGVRMRRVRQLWALAALPHVLTPRDRPDLVHAHQGEDVALLPLALLASRFHRCPLVVTVHCSVTHTMTGSSLTRRLVRWAGAAVERRVLPRADAVVVLTHRSRALLLADGVRPDEVEVIPSGFEPRLFGEPRGDAWPTTPRPRVGYVGRVCPQKRTDVAVDAFGRLQHDAELVVVGDGPDRAKVERQARQLTRGDHILFTGYVPHEDIPAVLASLDVMVVPSAYEELGSVIVEAMAAGLPVVASRVGGIPEAVEDGVTGVLVPAGDVGAFAAAVDRLLADPSLRHRMSAAALDRSAEYGWPTTADRVHRVYCRALERAREPHRAA